MGKQRSTAFSGPGSQPWQPNKKRRRPLNSLKSGKGKEFFSVVNSVVPLPGDNVEPSMQMAKKFPCKRGFEPWQSENEVRCKKRAFPLRRSLHRNNITVSFSCSGVPFQGDEMIHSNPRHSRRYKRRKSMSRVYIREDDHTAPVQVGQQYFTSLAQNRKTSFHSSSSPNKKPFSSSFEAAGCYEVPSPEKVDSALEKSTKRSHGKRSKNIGSNHTTRLPERGRDSENTNVIPLPAANKLIPLAGKESNCLTSTVFDDSNNYCILPKVNLDTPNCSDIGIRGDTACLPDSIIHVGKDAIGDLALKNIGSLDKEMDYPPVLVERALRCPFRKKLLVLDLNGILCDISFGSRGSCIPYKKVNSQSVFKRPFLDDFLAFCFERFVVGVWSSRNRKNIIGVIDYIMGDSKNKLLFCWDQSKCTFSGFNTIENRHKPLLLKELIKLWNKEEASLPWVKGEYSPSNTLLVDDSPYKAICNPPHTAIFPFPYEFRDEEDSVLGPGGPIRVFLESIAMADDVQEHVKKHSFGQHAITSENKMWSFYKNIIDKNNSMALT